MLTIKCFTFNSLLEHTYIIHDSTKQCAIIDPGCYSTEEQNKIVDYILKNNLNASHIINTHCHIDHILGNKYLKDKYNAKLYVHADELPILHAASQYAINYGFSNYQATKANVILNGNEVIAVGTIQLQVLHAPGHSPGHIILYSKADKICFVGDVIFLNSIGRVDLPGGNYQALMDSIKSKILSLPKDVIIYPGHGSSSTIGNEAMHNPYLR